MFNRLASVQLFFVLSVLLLAACIVGGVIPQNEPPEQYAVLYNRFSPVILRLSFHQVFSSYWFLVLLGISAVNLLCCSIERWKVINTRPGVFISHIAFLVIFAGGIMHGFVAQKGYLPLEAGQVSRSFFGNDNKEIPLPFDIRLDRFQIQYWEQEKNIITAHRASDGLMESQDVAVGKEAHFAKLGLTITPKQFYSNFAITEQGPISRDHSHDNPAVELTVKSGKKVSKKFLFSRFPDFHGAKDDTGIILNYEYLPGRIKQFESSLTILENGQKALEKKIWVNNPLKWKGYRFYQSGYDERNPNYSVLQVSKDSSVPVVYAGFILLLLGSALAFLKMKGS